MFLDLSQVKTLALVRLTGESNVPKEVLPTLYELIENDFPMDSEEVASLNEDTAEVAIGCMTDLILVALEENDIEDDSVPFAVTKVVLLPNSRLMFDVIFIGEEGEAKTEAEWD